MGKLDLERALWALASKEQLVLWVKFDLLACLQLLVIQPGALLRASIRHIVLTILHTLDVCMLR